VPPQAGVFTVTAGIDNTGPQPVTVEAVSILGPQAQASEAQGIRPWPVLPAGTARWRYDDTSRGVLGPASGTSVVGLRFEPGRPVMVGIPARMSSACYNPNGWTSIDAIYVKERFGPFTHWVTIRFRSSWILHEPADPRTWPAKDYVCR
jgi:hypothetical protein